MKRKREISYMHMQPTHLIIHYGEIALKGKNRGFFEQKLSQHIKKNLTRVLPHTKISVSRQWGRLVVVLPEEISENNLAEVKNALGFVPGIVSFSFAIRTKLDIDAMAEACIALGKARAPETFKIAARRSDKQFPLSSQEVNTQVGAKVAEALGAHVDLTTPQFVCTIEVTRTESFIIPSEERNENQNERSEWRFSFSPSDGTSKGIKYPAARLAGMDVRQHIPFRGDKLAGLIPFIYADKFPGMGGLPTGTGGAAAVMLSGGIDSPVAAYYMARRGVTLSAIHFHAHPYTSKQSIEKVRDLARFIARFDGAMRLYLIGLAPIQDTIARHAPEKLRVILYRRFMMRIADRIAKQEGLQAIITGESLGQVASQTIENMTRTQEVVSLPVFRPLVGFDKRDIVDMAQKIGTYETSILPHEDCCTLFVPAHPETKATKTQLEKAESGLDVERLVDNAIAKMTVETITPGPLEIRSSKSPRKPL